MISPINKTTHYCYKKHSLYTCIQCMTVKWNVTQRENVHIFFITKTIIVPIHNEANIQQEKLRL